MKSVCIVGAGPSGLVTAKTLLEAGGFEVTILEQNRKLGGLWMFEDGAAGNKYLSADTPTNLSRYSVMFSDLAWESVPLRNARLHMFPRAPQVGEYLEEYAKRFIPSQVIRYGHRVIGTKLVSSGKSASWEVNTSSAGGEETSCFDFLVHAAGFFSEPSLPKTPLPPQTKVTAIHSSTFKSLSDLYPDPSIDVADTGILVIGGANSGGEAAASIASQLSAALHGPKSSEGQRYKGVVVKHLIKRPFYAIPPFLASSSQPTFVPLDSQFYDLKWQQTDAPIVSRSGLLASDAIGTRHDIIQAMIGDQNDLKARALNFAIPTAVNAAPFAALSETYPEYVRSGSIQPIQAVVSSLCVDDGGWASAEALDEAGQKITVSRISAIVYATGYSANPTLEILPPDVRGLLEFDPIASRLPLLLQHWQTLNPAVPNLGFVGFYVGPYWGVMEMQARILVSLWSDSNGTSTSKLQQQTGESLENLRRLREAMADRAPTSPQYWFSDYTAYLEELSGRLDLLRNDQPFEHQRDGPVCPARYLSRGISERGLLEARLTMHTLHATLSDAKKGKYRARAIYRGLQGRWSLLREIASSRSEMPSGRFKGEAYFHPRAVTDPAYDAEYLYIESGKFLSDRGFEMTATRRYVYRYREEQDELSVWFVRPDDGLTVDYLFHKVDFAPVVPTKDEAHEPFPLITAKADHLCEQDMYDTNFSFSMSRVSLDGFEIIHAVKGPAKDYVAKAKYKRYDA